MALRDLSDFMPPLLEFPINGKTYTVPPISIGTGEKLSRIIAGKDAEAAEASPVELWRLLLGPVWDEMVTDGVSSRAAERVGLTALADFQYGREMAEATWEAGADPVKLEAILKRTAPQNRAARRAKPKAD